MEFHPCCMSYGNCDCDPRDAEIARLTAERDEALAQLAKMTKIKDAHEKKRYEYKAQRDEALILVAAAFEVAAGISVTGEPEISQITQYAIRSLTPVDATEALNQMLNEAYKAGQKKGHEEAINAYLRIANSYFGWGLKQAENMVVKAFRAIPIKERSE